MVVSVNCQNKVRKREEFGSRVFLVVTSFKITLKDPIKKKLQIVLCDVCFAALLVRATHKC